MKPINYAFQNISSSDVNAVIKTVKSQFLTQGPKVLEFETKIAKKVNANFAVAVNSASSALHLACLALDVGVGDWVWTTPNTYVASANCAIHCGAQIDFVDIDPFTYNMNVDLLYNKLKKSKSLNKLPKVVIPVHFAGQPCDMVSIYKLSKKFGFKIIEDASHAIGSQYNKIKVGSCRHSQITVFSFHPVKIITTGEGGMLLTNKRKIFEKLIRLRTNGVTNKKKFMRLTKTENQIWNYQQIELGFNFRLTEIQAALGVSQLKRLEKFLYDRYKVVQYYNKHLKDLPIILPNQTPGNYSSYHLYPVRLKLKELKKSQKEIFRFLKKKNINANLHYPPLHLHPFYKAMGFKKNDFREAEKYHKEVVTLPLYSGLKKNQLSYIVKVLAEAFR